MLPELTAPGASVRSGDFATASSSPATSPDPELEAIALSALAAAARAALPALKLLRPLGSAPPGGGGDSGGAGGGVVAGEGQGGTDGAVSPPFGRFAAHAGFDYCGLKVTTACGHALMHVFHVY